MRFRDDQAAARQRTRLCLALLALVVLLMALAGAGLALVFLPHEVIDYLGGRSATLGKVGLAIIGAIAIASLWKVRQLARRGGETFVSGLGAVALDELPGPGTRQLRNVVEEMALAAGVPVPRLYLLPEEPAINAFISGYGPADATLCLTQGALQHLTRDELQGVVAHEFSHLLNGDMRLNLRLVGWLHGISLVADIGRELFAERTSAPARVGGNSLLGWALGTALLVIGSCGLFFANLIQAAAARSRERLADASAVQFTRHPQGLADALKRIAAYPLQGRLYHPRARSVAHMVLGDSGASWFATHPPVLERIQRLEAGFDTAQLEYLRRAALLPQGIAYVAGLPAPRRASTDIPVAAEVMPALAEAASCLAGLPHELRLAAQDPARAADLLLLLAGASPGLAPLATAVARLHPAQRLPLAQLTFPALRRLPRDRLRALVRELKALLEPRAATELPSYCLACLIQRQLIASLAPARRRAPRRLRLQQGEATLVAFYALVAERCHDSPAAARRAFLLAMAAALPGRHYPYQPPLLWRPALEQGLALFERLVPAAREPVLQGLLAAIAADGSLRLVELELLHLSCALLELPLPTALPGWSSAGFRRSAGGDD